MAEWKPNNYTGTMFPNAYKKNQSHPDYTGVVCVDGEDYKIGAWWNEKNGKQFLKLKLKPKEEEY